MVTSSGVMFVISYARPDRTIKVTRTFKVQLLSAGSFEYGSYHFLYLLFQL